MNYQNVLIQNKEILDNERYKGKYDKFLNDLEKEINIQMKNKEKDLKKENIKLVKEAIDVKEKLLDSNMFKETYKKDNNYEDLIKDYSNFLNAGKEKDKISDKETLNIIFKNDLKQTKDILYYLITQKKSEFNKIKSSVDKEIRTNNFIIENNNVEPIIELNKTLEQQLNLLNKDKIRKDKEIEELVEKYKKLMDKRDDLKQQRQTAFMKSLRRSNLADISNNNHLLKSKGIYSELQGEEKGCNCEVKDICNLF